MTEREFLNYQMNDAETREWENLAADIKDRFFSVVLPDIPCEIKEDILNKRTMAKEPFYGSRGYIRNRGYYSVQEGDRGSLYLHFSDLSFEEAKNSMIKECAHDISYAYVSQNRSALRDKHKGLWHYCRIDDGIENVNGTCRMRSHLEEQTNWIYDEEYDYRKYWFELLLYMEKRMLPTREYERETAYYQECMNHSMTVKKWIFNIEQEEFQLET